MPAQHRVRRDRIDKAGKVTLRYRSQLRHLGVGRRYAGTRVMLLVADREVRVITDDGELLAQFTIDPTKNTNPKKTRTTCLKLSGMSRDTRPGCLATQQQRARRDSNPQPSDP